MVADKCMPNADNRLSVCQLEPIRPGGPRSGGQGLDVGAPEKLHSAIWFERLNDIEDRSCKEYETDNGDQGVDDDDTFWRDLAFKVM